MNYELAKELEKEGFKIPEDFKGGWFNYDPNNTELRGCYVPTLSELIEACGLKILLWEEEGEWRSVKYIEPVNTCPPFYEWEIRTDKARGDTPEEAVARLWLALNNK